MYFVILVAAFLVLSAVVASGVTLEADDAVIRYFKSVHGSARRCNNTVHSWRSTNDNSTHEESGYDISHCSGRYRSLGHVHEAPDWKGDSTLRV